MWGDKIRFHTYWSEEQLVRDKKTMRHLYSPGEQGDTVNRSKQFTILAMDWVRVLLRWRAQAWQGYYINGELVLSCEQRNCCKGEKRMWACASCICLKYFETHQYVEQNLGFGEEKRIRVLEKTRLFIDFPPWTYILSIFYFSVLFSNCILLLLCLHVMSTLGGSRLALWSWFSSIHLC